MLFYFHSQYSRSIPFHPFIHSFSHPQIFIIFSNSVLQNDFALLSISLSLLLSLCVNMCMNIMRLYAMQQAQYRATQPVAMSVNIKQNQPVCSTIYFRSMWAKHLQEHHHILFCYIFICVCRRYHTNKQAIHRRSTVVCCLDQTIQLMILMLILLLLMLLLLLLLSS